jgi:pimeloyl-ACP methyl ester carboxylesterase
MSFPYAGETKELNECTRKEAGGSYIALHDGVTHYELAGAENKRTVVLVHGFSVPYFIFDSTFDFLVNSGFRVLRYDLLGRGFSDRPNVNYDIDLFTQQLKNLLEALRLTNVNLLGLSMGGAITAAFISHHPEYVSKHILIDPAGAERITVPWLLEALKAPILGELALGLFGSGDMVKNIARDLFDPQSVEHFQDQYRIQMQYKGFKRAILSTMRSNMLDSFFETYMQVGRLYKPTLLIWGRNDRTVPFENSQLILKALPHAEFHAIDHCGHIPHYEKPEIVNPILLEFLSK